MSSPMPLLKWSSYKRELKNLPKEAQDSDIDFLINCLKSAFLNKSGHISKLERESSFYLNQLEEAVITLINDAQKKYFDEKTKNKDEIFKKLCEDLAYIFDYEVKE